ncbi:MAG: hypothetical protein GX823_07305, partial [Clostridiales bacterium]|nr:hypothetical protein [Clostridiales bacterium]
MDGRFDVTRAGVQYGVAELSQNGFMQDISFTGTAPDNNNVYRLAAVCGGRYVMLGVPVPDKSGRLTLVKSLSKTSCRELGFDSPGEFELVLPGENYVGQNDAQAEDEAGQKSDSEPENHLEAKDASPEPEAYIPMPSPPRENIQRHNMQNQNPWTRTQPRQSGKPAYTVKPDTPEKPVPLTKPDASEKPKP